MLKRTRIKICGITREVDLLAAVGAGADALGFVFYPPSPRYVSPQQALPLMSKVPAFITKVGLFVNESADTVRAALSSLPIDLLQFHGDETPAYCAQFGRPWIKAARVRPGLDLVEYAERFHGASGILLDAFVDEFGGSGQSFDWSLIPPTLSLPVILSGGLTVQNVGSAVSSVQPWAVDVSSGVEATKVSTNGALVAIKGIKDAQKISEFIAGVRDADARLSLSTP